MKWTQGTFGDLSDHWMVTTQRNDQPLPITVITRWQWYKKGSHRGKINYGLMEIITIGASAAIPVAVAAHLNSIITASLGAIVLIATSIRTTFGLHENWVEHSQVGYAIEREAALFLVASPPYDSVDATQKLVTQVENIAAQGGQRWANRHLRLDQARHVEKEPHKDNSNV